MAFCGTRSDTLVAQAESPATAKHKHIRAAARRIPTLRRTPLFAMLCAP
jgi:hypothetical protein